MITKFRAWNIESQCMLNHDFIVNTVIHNDAIVRDFSDILEHDDMFVLMQSTGLKDKNGKEIFEGDIVNIQYSDWYFDGEIEREYKNAVIYFDTYEGQLSVPSFYIKDKYGVRLLSELRLPDESIEVLGNIYENSHLLRENIHE